MWSILLTLAMLVVTAHGEQCVEEIKTFTKCMDNSYQDKSTELMPASQQNRNINLLQYLNTQCNSPCKVTVRACDTPYAPTVSFNINYPTVEAGVNRNCAYGCHYPVNVEIIWQCDPWLTHLTA